jgi:RNA polymerase sigma factor (sigma-70 family)
VSDKIKSLMSTKGSLPERAREDLEQHLEKYRKLILKIAHKYKRSRVEIEDLCQEAYIGLVLADKEFDEARSSNFHSYAISRIKHKMYEYCIANESPIYIPTHIAKASSYVKQMRRLLNNEPPFIETGISSDEVILVNKHPIESVLNKSKAFELREMKRKLGSIATNSKMSYERLAGMALDSISLIVSDDILSKTPLEEALEENIFSKEVDEKLLELVGEKKFIVLTMKLLGWNFREIAEYLHRLGHSNRQGEVVSRQAVKGMLDDTVKIIRNSGILNDS